MSRDARETLAFITPWAGGTLAAHLPLSVWGFVALMVLTYIISIAHSLLVKGISQ